MTPIARTSRAAVGMGAIAALSRLIGFVRVLVVAAVLGTTYLGNAFQAANSVSNILFELLAAGALSAVLVPAFVSLLDAGDDEAAEEVAGGVLGIALLVLGAVSVAGIVGAPQLAHALTVGVPSAEATEQRELITHLLRFFVPQVMLYAAGTIATAVLYAKRRFAVTAAAPIGNTLVMVACLIAFRAAADTRSGFDLSSGQRWLLVAAGSGGVLAFVGSLLIATRLSGFRLRPRWPTRDPRVMEVLRHSGWGVVLHSGAGLLLGGAVILGGAVPGGVVAYQVAWVFFLAPYAIFAQPIHTAILPELVAEARDEDMARFRSSIRWSMERMALLVLPVTAALMALALPAMRIVSFGEVGAEGPGLLAAALVTLAVGLFPYGLFLLLARAYYALGDSRTPGLVALVAAAAGIGVMVAGAALTHGSARIGVLGLGHSAAYLLGAAWLARGLSERAGGSLWPHALGRMTAVAGLAGLVAWGLTRQTLGDPSSRATEAATVAVISLVGLAIIVGGYRMLGLHVGLTQRIDGHDTVPDIPEVPV